jgi:hypothetical protein
MVDTSDHKKLKLVPVLVQYLTLKMRVQNKVTKFHNSEGKMADVLKAHIMNVLHKYKL